ncbi:elongation of very long chain fatty acids protein AAEL008004-like [Gryllus bimaculatus]|nr:elongation of very long chain fatty acids protein AAEL008004-like [Gryllus bimaculatus]
MESKQFLWREWDWNILLKQERREDGIFLKFKRNSQTEVHDPRWKNYFLVETPWPVLFIICNYIYFVKVCGPKFMKNREAFKIEWLIKVYNTVQIIWNLNLFFYVFRIAYHAQFMEDFNAWCLPLNCSEDDAFSMMIQFVIVFIHNLAVFFVKSCNYGLFITLLTLVQAIYFIYMFTNFYLKTYRKEIKKN